MAGFAANHDVAVGDFSDEFPDGRDLAVQFVGECGDECEEIFEQFDAMDDVDDALFTVVANNPSGL